uniref:Uncharacterized protein n=1 Tax=Amphimedon queenslandica TaxID=400682 RepID=A0A1X7URG2_AMPQE
MVLLIGRVYGCSSNHEYLSYSPSILKAVFPPWFQFPFHIQHRVGFVYSFLQFLFTLTDKGFEITEIVDIIGKRRSHQKWSCNKIYSIVPSRYLITSSFVSHFFEKMEDFYMSKMTSLCCRGSISLDHTIKVATNIGYQRTDGKWVTQYKALFINEDGQVLSWQFTKTKSFEDVKTLILQVSKRMTALNKNISTIYIDDCCSWRQLLQSSLGYEVNVKLDLFHAVQRITKHEERNTNTISHA